MLIEPQSILANPAEAEFYRILVKKSYSNEFNLLRVHIFEYDLNGDSAVTRKSNLQLKLLKIITGQYNNTKS
jgi:hypothetical protein